MVVSRSMTSTDWLADIPNDTEEYAIFAPLRDEGGPKLFGYHRGEFGRWEAWPSEDGALRSTALGGLILKVAEENSTFLRVHDVDGTRLPSEAEAARAERRRALTAERKAAAEQRRALVAEREAQQALERIATLEAELARLRSDSTND